VVDKRCESFKRWVVGGDKSVLTQVLWLPDFEPKTSAVLFEILDRSNDGDFGKRY